MLLREFLTIVIRRRRRCARLATRCRNECAHVVSSNSYRAGSFAILVYLTSTNFAQSNSNLSLLPLKLFSQVFLFCMIFLNLKFSINEISSRHYIINTIISQTKIQLEEQIFNRYSNMFKFLNKFKPVD